MTPDKLREAVCKPEPLPFSVVELAEVAAEMAEALRAIRAQVWVVLSQEERDMADAALARFHALGGES